MTSAPSALQIERDSKDAGVVVAEPEAGRENRGIAVVELHAQGAAAVAYRYRGIEPAVLHRSSSRARNAERAK